MHILNSDNAVYYDSWKKLYEHPLWQRKRMEILYRDDFKCSRCGCDDLPLHVHHDYYETGLAPWEYDNEYLRTLCMECHYDAHMKRAA